MHTCRHGVLAYRHTSNLSARLSVEQKTQVKLLMEEGFFSSDSTGNDAEKDASNSLALVESQGEVTKASKWKQLSLGHMAYLLAQITMDERFVSRLTPHNKRALLYYSLHVAPADNLPTSSSSSAVAANSNNPKCYCYESSCICLPLLTLLTLLSN